MKKFLFHNFFFLFIIFFGILFFSCVSAQSTPSEPDVYVLKDIIIPLDFGPYQPSSVVQIIIEDKRIAPTTFPQDILVDVEIRNKSGATVYPGQSDPVDFSATPPIGTANFPFSKLSGVQLVDGETYTLEAHIPRGDNSSGKKESVNGNNRAIKTFVLLKPNQSYAIPDSPWWMSVVVFFSVVACLLVASRKNVKKSRIK